MFALFTSGIALLFGRDASALIATFCAKEKVAVPTVIRKTKKIFFIKYNLKQHL